MCRRSVGNCVDRVAAALIAHMDEFIYWPTDEDERARIQQQFLDVCGMPSIIGSIDCTHLTIKKPTGDRAVQFFNRLVWCTA